MDTQPAGVELNRKQEVLRRECEVQQVLVDGTVKDLVFTHPGTKPAHTDHMVYKSTMCVITANSAILIYYLCEGPRLGGGGKAAELD